MNYNQEKQKLFELMNENNRNLLQEKYFKLATYLIREREKVYIERVEESVKELS